jgi:hypothetical protein
MQKPLRAGLSQFRRLSNVSSSIIFFLNFNLICYAFFLDADVRLVYNFLIIFQLVSPEVYSEVVWLSFLGLTVPGFHNFAPGKMRKMDCPELNDVISGD